MDVAGVLQLLRRRWVAVVLCVLAGVGGALLHTARTPEVYRADARVFVNVPSASNAQQGAQGLQLTSELLPSYAQVATSRRVAERVKRALDLPEPAEVVRRKLTAAPEPQTLIIDVSATDGDPVRARSIADAATVALAEAVAELERERTVGAAIKVDILDSALTPTSPVEPRPAYELALGLLLGAAAGVLLALVLDGLDRTVKTPVQAEASTGAPLLGMLPRFRRGASQLLVASDDAAAEAYRTLRTSVRFLDPDDPLQVLLVTSASAGEGKSTTAVNLAIALAQSGERVALVDADLRRAAVATRLGIEGAVGLTSVITRQVSLDDALQTWGPMLVLPSGPLPPNPSEIVGSQSMGAVLDDLRRRVDVVVVDAPPVVPVTDAVVLATQVDGVLLVCRAGKAQRQLVVEARRRLDGVGASVVGVVLNAVQASAAQGYYAAYRPLPQVAEA